ncbi:MAG: T9SS type A sorting domain-containing protein [bacterium]|nr:T9SS type A sorting domain-containing protein [bacterium]
MKFFLLLLTGVFTTAAFGQVADTETIDGNNVQAIVSDEGLFFFDGQSTVHGYNIPAGSALGTIYAASIWAGGIDQMGQLRFTAPLGGNNGWRSGPIANNADYGTVNYTNHYGQSVWKVTRQEVDDHIAQYQQGGYTPVSAISDWPGNGDVSLGVADQLAPFVDMDNDGVYEPLEGDYPDFPGDQVVYVIQNDESYLPQPSKLGVELHLMFYQYNTSGYMGESTFLNVRAFNRSGSSYSDFKLSIYADFDIGNYADDYIGSSVSNNMLYGYNGDNFDETNGLSQGYEDNPPCQAIKALNHDLYAASTFYGGGSFPTSAPTTIVECWNFMNGFWADGSPMFYGGNAYNAGVTTTPTKIIFPGSSDPTGIATNGAIINDDWAEYNADGGSPNPPGDRRGLMTIAPGDFLAETMVCADFVFLFDDNDMASVDNVDNVENIATALQVLYDNSSDFPCGNFMAALPEQSPIEFNVFPNPSTGNISVQVINISDPAIIEVRDMTGRLVHSEISQLEKTKLYIDAPAGVYQVVVQSPHSKVMKSLVIQ